MSHADGRGLGLPDSPGKGLMGIVRVLLMAARTSSCRVPRAWTVVVVLAVLLLPAMGTGTPGQWPQWRGVRRDGVASGPPLDDRWPQRLMLAWERQIGEGYSGPVVDGDRVWVHSRQGENEVVSCVLLSKGETIWSKSYVAPFHQDDDARSHGRGPYSTPCVSDGRLFTFGVNSVLSAWDSSSGRLLWRRESGKEFDPGFPYFGQAASPVVWNQLCFVHLGGHHREGAARPDTGAIVALNVADGGERWRWSGDAPAAGASPLICEIEGQPQLVSRRSRTLWPSILV